MTHSKKNLNDDYNTKNANALSISLNIPKKSISSSTHENGNANSIVSSVSSSASSVMFTNSYCSSDYTKVNESDLLFNKLPADKWQQNAIKEWLEYIGMLPMHIKNCLKYIKTGKV